MGNMARIFKSKTQLSMLKSPSPPMPKKAHQVLIQIKVLFPINIFLMVQLSPNSITWKLISRGTNLKIWRTLKRYNGTASQNIKKGVSEVLKPMENSLCESFVMRWAYFHCIISILTQDLGIR